MERSEMNRCRFESYLRSQTNFLKKKRFLPAAFLGLLPVLYELLYELFQRHGSRWAFNPRFRLG
jgi:hypothetical protein